MFNCRQSGFPALDVGGTGAFNTGFNVVITLYVQSCVVGDCCLGIFGNFNIIQFNRAGFIINQRAVLGFCAFDINRIKNKRCPAADLKAVFAFKVYG